MSSLTCIALVAILDYWCFLASGRSLTKKTPAPLPSEKQVCLIYNSLLFFFKTNFRIYTSIRIRMRMGKAFISYGWHLDDVTTINTMVILKFGEHKSKLHLGKKLPVSWLDSKIDDTFVHICSCICCRGWCFPSRWRMVFVLSRSYLTKFDRLRSCASFGVVH